MTLSRSLLASGSSLQAAAGLHYLMSNHHQILSDTLYKQFEIPLLQHLDTHKANIEASEAQYERSMREMSQKIKETEATSLQNGRKRQRGKLCFCVVVYFFPRLWSLCLVCMVRSVKSFPEKPARERKPSSAYVIVHGWARHRSDAAWPYSMVAVTTHTQLSLSRKMYLFARLSILRPLCSLSFSGQ